MQENVFKRPKMKIAQVPLLKYYSSEEELTLQCDASESGLSAALTQNGKPVAYGSRAMTMTEKGYGQIERMPGHCVWNGEVPSIHKRQTS